MQEKTRRMGLHRGGNVVTVLDMEITRRNRKTGTTIIVRDDEFLGWVTICETHGAHCEHQSKTAAVQWMADPVVWCQGCAEAVA